MPPRNYYNSYSSQPPRSNKLLPYLAFILFAAFFIFKVDVIISQTIYGAKSNQESIKSSPKIETTTSSSKIETTSSTVVPDTPHISNGTFHRNFTISWGDNRASIREDGELLTLSLDNSSGSGFESKKEFLFGRIDMQIKLIAGDSAGTITTYYFSSEVGDHHDEIDFEFLGNSTGNPYTLHTNVFSQGKGEREQQFFLWFDPTADFHTYSILWNPKCIIWFVDNQPIREYKNTERLGVPYLKNQPMRIYSSLWNAEEWATQGGKVRTNWSLAPFVASYRKFSADGCIWSYSTQSSSCSTEDFLTRPVLNMELDRRSRARMQRLQRDHMVYNYCRDKWRFRHGPGPECRINA